MLLVVLHPGARWRDPNAHAREVLPSVARQGSEDAGVPARPVYEVEDALSNPQVEARGTVTELDTDDDRGPIPVVEHPLKFEHAETGFGSPPPRLGEHTREVLREADYSEAEIDEPVEAGAFGDSQRE